MSGSTPPPIVESGGAVSGARLIEPLAAYLRAAAARGHRATLVIADERPAALALAEQVLPALPLTDVSWYSDRAPEGAAVCFGEAAFGLLGGELDALVFDAWAGFDPDAFGALSGTVRAGGLMLLLTPPLEAWPRFADPQHERITVAPYPADSLRGRFLQRLARLLREHDASLLIESGTLTRLPRRREVPTRATVPPAIAPPCRTADQQRAVAALVKVATGHRRRPVVLTSDRGRGKSAAFGIAAAQLAAEGRRRIVLSAPRADAVVAVYAHAEALLPGARQWMRYVAPDELLRTPCEADLVLVDEAAAIPAPVLEGLLKRYPRIAFATTVHGYEGTGRGFAIRFTHALDVHTNSWKSLELKTPIRWAADDPLEALVFRLLALDAEPARATDFATPFDTRALSFERLERDALVGDEALLCELFGLLVQAHYRTRPLDLRHLLDGPNIEIYVVRSRGHIAATALLAREGGFDADTAAAITAGRSRPHGHLLPETLAAHQGLAEAPTLRCGRIMRLTVHPSLQRRGLGSRLVGHIAARMREAGMDFVGTSFGATTELLAFWQAQGWSPVRLSIRKGAASGAHSAVLIAPLAARADALCALARRRFFAQFSHQLSDSLRDLDARLAGAMLTGADSGRIVLNTEDRQDLHAFAEGQRLAEVAIGALWRLALQAFADARATRLQAAESALLMVRVVQKNDWATSVRRCGLSGRKEALALLRQAVRKLLN